jgi:hypothetical protein
VDVGIIKAGPYEFRYNPLTTEVFADQIGTEWEVEIYKYKHYQGSLEIDSEGKLLITEEFGLNLVKTNEYLIEIK